MQKFIIFAAGYNCQDMVKKHMMSVQRQSFDNYEHIIVDDASTDGTMDEIEKYADGRTTIIQNKENKGWIYNAIEYLKQPNYNPTDVLAILDLDDWLARPNVFEMLNDIYNQGYWVTYGSLMRSTGEIRENNLKGYSKEELGHKQFRKAGLNWRFWALRTFKGFIWDNLNKKDLLGPHGEYPPTSYDWGIGFPIIEMTPPEKIYHVTDVIYVYHVHPYNDKASKRDKQIFYCNWFRGKETYQRLPIDYDSRYK
jgi:glycosyltransferase involved in cell wall biosynthesis